MLLLPIPGETPVTLEQDNDDDGKKILALPSKFDAQALDTYNLHTLTSGLVL